MEAYIMRIITAYPRYKREVALFEKRLEMRENPDMRDKLTVLQIRLNVIESWFALLDSDERFVLRILLSDPLDENPPQRVAATIWMRQISKEHLTPCEIHNHTIQKISIFFKSHKKMMQAVFDKAALE